MRPVNLIPVELRLGRRAALRGGPVAYIVVGALVAALAGVTLLVVTSNQISHNKTQVAQLERENTGSEGPGDQPRRLHPVQDRPRPADSNRHDPCRQPL